MIIKADRWPLYQRPYTDFFPDKVSSWWPCVHIFLGMGIFTMMFTPHLNPQSISSSQPWSPPGHDWVPAYSWSNSKLIFLILNNEKPWAPWRRKTEKLIDQLSLSFFKAAPYVQSRTEGHYGHNAVIFDILTLDTLREDYTNQSRSRADIGDTEQLSVIAPQARLPHYHKLFSG